MARGYIAVLAGGALGTLLRYAAGTFIMTRFGGRFPLGTLAVNVSGCFLMGLLMTLFTERFAPHPHLRLLLTTGFLGGFTTFSALEWETYAAVRDGDAWIGLLNLLASAIVGYVAVLLGVVLGRQ